MLGIDIDDEKDLVSQVLEQNRITFPNILDTSPAAEEAMKQYETLERSEVPLTYLIDREGKIMDAWYGYDESGQKLKDAVGMMKLEP